MRENPKWKELIHACIHTLKEATTEYTLLTPYKTINFSCKNDYDVIRTTLSTFKSIDQLRGAFNFLAENSGFPRLTLQYAVLGQTQIPDSIMLTGLYEFVGRSGYDERKLHFPQLVQYWQGVFAPHRWPEDAGGVVFESMMVDTATPFMVDFFATYFSIVKKAHPKEIDERFNEQMRNMQTQKPQVLNLDVVKPFRKI